MTIVRRIHNRIPTAVAQAVGSLSFAGGASTANSPTARILRTGAMDWNGGTIDFWIAPSATAADNAQEIAAGANYNLTNSNIIWDADSQNTRGFIIGLSAGAICFGINTSGGARTIVGATDLRNGQFHHVAVYRNGATMEIFVDGNREATFSTAPSGVVTYDGDAPATDQYHYLCKEKLSATFGCDCLLSEIRVSDNQRYSGATYTVPTAPFADDANTVGLYHLDEQTGTTMGDISGNGFDGELLGSPVPAWSSSSPFP